MTMKKTLAILIAFATSFTFLNAQPGSIDSSFGTNGKTVFTAGSSIALQSDGKILVTKTEDTKISVTRYFKNGKIDKSFGNNGTASTNFFGPTFLQSSDVVAVMSDGKIIVASGVFNGDVQESFLCLACFNPTGIIDSSFGTNGQVETPVAEWNADATGIVVQPNGNFIVSINAFIDFTQMRKAAIRFKKDGTEDKDYYIQFSIYDLCYAMAAQSDGRIIITGSSQGAFNLFRFNKNGVIDKSFGKKGITLLPNYLAGLDVAVLPDDKIVAVTTDSMMIQFQSNGKVDTSFGRKGKLHLPFKPESIAIQKDGKIIVAGSMNNGTNTDFALARYLPSGYLDKSFGTNGITITDFGGSEEVWDMAIQTDNKIIASGRGGMARYRAGHVATFRNIPSSLPASFNIELQPNPANNYINISGLQQNKKNIVEITDASGLVMIKQITSDKNFRCDISRLHPGIYYLFVMEEGGIVKKSFIKE